MEHMDLLPPVPVVPQRSPQRPCSSRQEAFQPSVDYYPDVPSLMNPEQHSGRTRRPAIRPDNVYRNQAPIDILADNDNDDITGPLTDQSPDHSGGAPGDNGPLS